MKLKDYIADHVFYLALFLFVSFLILSILYLLNLGTALLVYIALSLLVLGVASFCYGYTRKNKFYKNVYSALSSLKEKYLLGNIVPSPSFYEGKIIMNIINEICTSTTAKIGEYKYSIEDFREYLEMWVHEIKTPLASSKLILENNPSPISESLLEENKKIELLLEQVLYYSRSSIVNQDYIIKAVSLKEIVNETVVSLRKNFLSSGVAIEINNLDFNVSTDKKWIKFILSQILTNSIKYTKDKSNPKVEIAAEETKEYTILCVRDNGIGISKADLPRVFEKGFTGENGRSTSHSTGMGLYIAKKLCDKLGHKIILQAVEQEFCTIQIYFAKNHFINF